jgi:hypothetical protein
MKPGKSLEWQSLYQNVLSEGGPERLPEAMARAEAAIQLREKQLTEDAGHQDERRAIADPRAALRILKLNICQAGSRTLQYRLVQVVIRHATLDVFASKLIGSVSMNLQAIITELKKERDRLDRAIAALDESGGNHRSTATHTTGAAKAGQGRRKSRLSPAGRKRLSELMKKRWADRRKKAGNGRKAVPKAA